MGLLQRLLGRRDTPDTVPDTTAPDDEIAGDNPVQTAVGTTSGTTESDIPEPRSEEDPQNGDDPAPSVIELPVQSTPVEHESTDTAPEDKATTATEPEETVADNEAMFTPPRPRRDLLTLAPPPPPRPERLDDVVEPESPRPALADANVSIGRLSKLATTASTTLWAAPVTAESALPTWLSVRQTVDETGWMPVLLGSSEDWRDGGESIIHESSQELDRASQLDPSTILQHKAAEAGEPARGVPILQRRRDTDFDTPSRAGLIGLVKADHSWQLPALLSWKGSTNWELHGAEHAAILNYWNQKYDIEIIAMTFDVIELFVANPPQDDNEALEVAHEAFAYCPDLLDSGVPTIQDLAEHMVKSRAWYFQWT
ncbi:DUF4253 domain-containing protein [Haloglycomyces albus]|uniref:DUF4253 domain-containing protein n=1 Tax=Haloglycomyces albus TaxID=526067 RepID=UPI00046D0630|nr:DUF4253 domain-containing protein [Haloglycomyces albus]